ncbi:MAG TPA: hypothetical protein ACQGQH_06560 [Xylella sp.]
MCPPPNESSKQLLINTYSEDDHAREAIPITEAFAAKAPIDKKVQISLANVYMQAEKMNKAAVMDQLGIACKLTEGRE